MTPASAATSSPSARADRDMIFVSMEDWDDIWRRNQFLCAALARRHPQSKILFIGVQRNVARHVAAANLGPLLKDPTWTVPEYPNIAVTRPIRVAPESTAWGLRFNQWLIRRHVRRLARRLGLRRPILWLNPHYATHLIGAMDESAVIYDITDDWTALTQSPRLRQRVVEQDAELCRRADAVIVCSPRLLELKSGISSKVYLIPNGVHAEHYRPVLDGTGPLPQPAQAWQRPVLGYTGTIHADRMDLELLEKVARGLDRGSIVLIGPSHLSAQDTARLQQTGRVILTGPVPYAQLPAYMRGFDVCIAPHRVTPFTESLNPIKLWEYLAAGKPIVATAAAGFRDYPQLVRIAAAAPSFLAAVAQALAEGDRLAPARRAEAERHSWDARVDAVEAVLRACVLA